VARSNLTVLLPVKYVDKRRVRARYGDVSDMTIDRWVRNPEVGFPAPVQFCPGGKSYWDIAKLDAFDEERAAQLRQRKLMPLRHNQPGDVR
jgi:hypothetical protein